MESHIPPGAPIAQPALFEAGLAEYGGDAAGILARRFGAVPFTIFDGRGGDWISRKRLWHAVIGDRGESREALTWNKAGGSDPVSLLIRGQGLANGVSLLDPVLTETLLQWFTPTAGHVVDPCAGDTVAGYVAGALGFRFTGIEIRQEQADLNSARVQRAGFGDRVRYCCDDGEKILEHVPTASADLLFSCPPYHNLERYSDDPADLSTLGYDAFIDKLGRIIAAGVATLRPNRFAVYIVGDLRAPGGGYRRFPDHVKDAFARAGMTLWNHGVLLTPTGSAAVRAGRPMALNRSLTKVHQDVLVFYRGDPAAIRRDFGAQGEVAS